MILKFRNVSTDFDLINSEGPLLSLKVLELADEHLHLKAIILQGKRVIYCKVNDWALDMFFHGKLTTFDLFMLRKDEPFLVQDPQNNTDIRCVWCDSEFEQNVLSTIVCGSLYYFQLPEGMGLPNPCLTVLKWVKSNFSNGIKVLYNNPYFGKDFIREYNNILVK